MLYYKAALRRELAARESLVIDVNQAYAGGKKAAEHMTAIRKAKPK